MHRPDSYPPKPGSKGHHHDHDHDHNRDQDHHHPHDHEHESYTGHKTIKIVTNILDANNRIAEENRRAFAAARVHVINIISSPGTGKTTLLEATLKHLLPKFKIGVIEGDIATTNDAQRIAAFNVPVVQIMTNEFGGACHLEAAPVRQALEQIDLHSIDLLFVENVGNLVCPAEFDLGEHEKVVLCSVTEGEDKPLKYPLAFQVSNLALINKIDLLPHLEFDMKSLHENIHRVNPKLTTLEISARTEKGLQAWFNWIRSRMAKK